jgi:hypothetical protein
VVIVGIVAIAGAVAATGNGRDNSGKIVRTSSWANDVCGTIGAWEGRLEDIRDDPAPGAEIELQPYAKRSELIFLAAVLVTCLFGFVEEIRPTVSGEDGGTEPSSVTPIIQMVMLTAAALILLFAKDRAVRNRLDGRHVHRQQ